MVFPDDNYITFNIGASLEILSFRFPRKNRKKYFLILHQMTQILEYQLMTANLVFCYTVRDLIIIQSPFRKRLIN